MFRLSYRTVNLLNNALKGSRKCYFHNNKNLTAIVRLPGSITPRAFYSNDSKSATNPLLNLVNKDNNEQQANSEKEDAQKEEEDKKNREQSWKRMKYTFMAFGLSFTCLGAYLIVELGKPRIDEEGNPIVDRFTKYPIWKQYLLRTLNEMEYYKNLFQEPSRDKLLPDPLKPPYYQPKYTLVLEFTDVLVHPDWTYSTGWRFKKRPGIDHFLESLAGVYEIVVYTAEQGMTVFPIVDAIDPKNIISFKLVRDATLFVDGQHVKDMAKLNRDLSKTIVIDWKPDCTKFHPENVMPIPRWKGNDDDVTLLHLSSFLLAIAQNNIDDVREVLTYYNQFDDPLEVFKEKQKKLIEMAEEQAELSKNQQSQAPALKRWSPSFLKKQF